MPAVLDQPRSRKFLLDRSMERMFFSPLATNHQTHQLAKLTLVIVMYLMAPRKAENWP